MKGFLICIVLYCVEIEALNPCNRPNLPPGRRIVCDQLFAFDRASRQQPVASIRTGSLPGIAQGAPMLLAASIANSLPSTRDQCLSIECVCQFIQGSRWTGRTCNLPDGNTIGRVLRKEFRMLTTSERDLFRRAFLAVRETTYNTLGVIHSDFTRSPGAHSGPNFPGWHREFLKRLELAMRSAPVTTNGVTRYPYANVHIPYWDSRIDNDIDRLLGISSYNSVMFSSELMGSVRTGDVIDGIFGEFVGAVGQITRRAIDRFPGQVSLFTRNAVDKILANPSVNDILAATAGPPSRCPPIPNDNLEIDHGGVHVWIGGHMEQITTSTNDPVFFLHHSFCDNIWEQWRLRWQTRSQRQSQWNNASTSCYSEAHLVTASMTPFIGFTNLDGLSNSYTDNLYGYAPSPKCNSSNPNGCNSTYLWCHTVSGSCVARLKAGSPCQIFNNIDPCYNSACSSRVGKGVCQPIVGIGGAPPPPLQLAPVQSADVTEDETCVNLNQCCGPWSSRGECESNTAVLRVVCPASCGRCTPKRSLADACANRVTLCPLYVMQGKCKSNRDWMAENCRMACNLCKKTRAKSCPASTKRPQVVGSQAGGSQGGGLGVGAPNIASVTSAPNVVGYDGIGDDAETYEDSGYQANDSQAATSDGSRYDAAGDDAKNYENIGSQTISSTTDAYSSETIATTTEYLPSNLTSSSPLPKCQVSKPMKPKPGNNTNNLLNGPVRNHSVCLNSHFCCQKWSSSGKCNSDKDIMSRICRASCVCKIGNNPSRCADFIKNCLSYKKQGLCGVDYMKENCRLTCRSCFSLSQQEHMCATPVRNITQPVETGISY